VRTRDDGDRVQRKGACGRKTRPNTPDRQSQFLRLLTGQTIGRRSASSRCTGRRSTRWRRAGRWRTDSVSSRRRDRALANYYRARGRSYYFAWVTFHRGARTTIRQRRRCRTSRWLRRPVSHWLEFARTGGRHICCDAQRQGRNSGNSQKSRDGYGETSTQLHTLQ